MRSWSSVTAPHILKEACSVAEPEPALFEWSQEAEIWSVLRVRIQIRLHPNKWGKNLCKLQAKPFFKSTLQYFTSLGQTKLQELGLFWSVYNFEKNYICYTWSRCRSQSPGPVPESGADSQLKNCLAPQHCLHIICWQNGFLDDSVIKPCGGLTVDMQGFPANYFKRQWPVRQGFCWTL